MVLGVEVLDRGAAFLWESEDPRESNRDNIASIWEIPKISGPNIDPQIVELL